jgi:hypothetical protein
VSNLTHFHFTSTFFQSLPVFILALSIQNAFGQFSGETHWAGGQGIGSVRHWIADFNGDGIADKLNYITNGNWWVALSNGRMFQR